jgi:hypothetical protein
MTPEANLQSFMQRFNTTYTVYYNCRHHRSGHFYQGRYRAVLVEADHYLLELGRYLHLNPVRIKKYSNLGIQEKQEIIHKYPWSSYGGYIRERDIQSFVSYSKILEMIGGKDDREGRRRYKVFVISGIMKDMNMTFWEGVKGKMEEIAGEMGREFGVMQAKLYFRRASCGVARSVWNFAVFIWSER